MVEIWFITVFEKLEQDSLGWPDLGSRDCWGFYVDKDTAFNVVENNKTDLRDGCNYDYAVCEKYREGIAEPTLDRQFFKYNKETDKYEKISEPDWMTYICGFSLAG